MADDADATSTRRSVTVSLAVACVEAVGLGIAAWLSGSAALGAQTADNTADVAVEVFLLIGVLSSARPADDSHPLGYGRERFFWSLLAALGIFVGGGGFGLEGAVQSALHPSVVHDYPIAYVVLATTVSMDAFALGVSLRPLRKQAAGRGISLRSHFRRSTDPASSTVVLAGGGEVIGGFVAAAGLVSSQLARSALPDAVASALIGVLLLVVSVLLLRSNRELLTGRGLSPHLVGEMRQVVRAQPGVLDVPDLFAVVVGPQSFIVDGDVTFEDDLDVPAVEKIIAATAVALRERWPSIEYLYLTPVPGARPRRLARSGLRPPSGKRASPPGASPPPAPPSRPTSDSSHPTLDVNPRSL
jgi:cation diffusion facilitator family transporter